MKSIRRALAALSLSIASLLISPHAISQVRTNGCGSPVVLDSKVNQLQIVCNQNNSKLNEVVKKFNDLARRKILSPSDLKNVEMALNQKLDKIKDNTDEILILLGEVLNRLQIAEQNPERAPLVLKPYLDVSADLTNKSYTLSDFLDANGKTEVRFVFSVQGNCQLFIAPPRGTGFTVGLAVLSDRGTPIWRALMGTQGRYKPIAVSTGIYQFVMFARRDAGQYASQISARCA